MLHSEVNKDGLVTIFMEKLLPLPAHFDNQAYLRHFVRGLLAVSNLW